MRKLEPLNLTEKERERLSNIINSVNDDNILVVIPCEIIYYYDLYMDINEIIEETGISRKTIFNYVKKYRKNKNFMFENRKNHSNLDKHKDIIRRSFKNNPVSSYRKAQSRIKEVTGIDRSLTQVYYFLKKNNYQKNKEGYYTRNGEPNIKRKDTYLYQHIEEIGKYIEQNPSDNKKVMINRVKNKFPEIKKENDDEIEYALHDYL